MYKYQRAVGLYSYGANGPQLIDLTDLKLSSLMKNVTKLNAIISNSFYPDTLFNIDLFDYYNELVKFDNTFQAWLDSKEGVVLKCTTKNIFKGEFKYASFIDLQEFGFTLKPGDTTLGDDMQDRLTIGTAPDIRLAKNEKLDYNLLANSALFTINGHFTRVTPSDNALYILNGSKHFKVYDNIHVGAINLNGLTTLTTSPITADQIVFDETYGALHVKITFNKSIKGKKVWLVVAGKLYTEDSVEIIADDAIKLKLGNTHWARSLFDSQPYIDLEPIINSETQVITKETLLSKSFYYDLLTHSTSFSIILDNPYIATEVEPLLAMQYPCSFLSTNNKYRHPLMLKNGMFPCYLTRDVGDDMLIDIDIFFTKHYLADTTGYNNGGDLYHNVIGRFEPVDLPRGQFFKIKSMV